MVLVTIVFLGAGVVLAYAGIYLIVANHRGTPIEAKIVDCQVAQNGFHSPDACRGRWTIDGHVVEGTVEGATLDDEGKTLKIHVTGQHGWKQGAASGVAGPALFFAVLCLILGIYLPLDARRRSRRA